MPRRVHANRRQASAHMPTLVYHDATVDDDRAKRMAFLEEFHALGRDAADEPMPDFARAKFGRELVDLTDDEVKQ